MFSTHHTMKPTSLLILLTILLATLLPRPALAQAGAPPVPTSGAAPQILTTPAGVEVTWSAPPMGEVSAAALTTLLPTVRHHGYDLPMQAIVLTLPPDVTPAVRIEQVTAAPLAGALLPGAPVTPPVLDWEPGPHAAEVEPLSLPTAPAFILRAGLVRGQHVAVLAISPIYEENGVIKAARAIKVMVPAARSNGEATLAAMTPAEIVTVPMNEAALQNGYKIIVSQPGLQEVPLSAFGAGFDVGQARLSHQGQTIAFEQRDNRLRFFAPAAGDRWNLNAVYWLTLDGAGARMATQNNPPAAPAGQAYARGLWRNNKLYTAEFAGPDNDRWFTAKLSAKGAMTQSLSGAVAPIARQLPDVTGAATYTASVTIAATVPSRACEEDVKGYKLRAELLNGVGEILETQNTAWNPGLYTNGICQVQENWEVAWTTNARPAALKLTLQPSGVANYDTSVLLDALMWERPVALNFGNAGAEFWTQPGAWSFTLKELPSARALYDVTDPARPVLIPLSAGAEATFTQADSPTPRHYLLANLTTAATPTVATHEAVNFGNVEAANAIYIGPAIFREELQPLLDLRARQGYTPLFVDVQAIFDVYSGGYISAPAIRNFLRDRTHWQELDPSDPEDVISVVLAGDGTYDPYNYRETAIGSDKLHPIPPYMLDVDVYINEAPCEACFAQLNGDDPITGDQLDGDRNPKSNFFVPDVWLGRFPVRNEAELTAMVNKIVTYESASGIAAWGMKHLLLADNYIKSINGLNQVTVDGAGDFARFTDELLPLYGPGADVTRIYYDHSPERRVPEAQANNCTLCETMERYPPELWRVRTAPETTAAALNALNAGVGLMVYNGHSNHWFYAELENTAGAKTGNLLSIVETPFLSNGDRLFVGLSMTCLTSQFAIPAVSGTIDEIFVRNPNGGAIATWGPSGLSVAHGHDYLQRGFVSALHNAPAGSQRMGALVAAGYESLLYSPLTNWLDALKTFVVLGDPLTRPRISTGGDGGILLPAVQR